MNNNYEKLFKQLDSMNPPQQLYEKIFAQIIYEVRRALIVRLTLIGSIGFIALIGLVPTLRYAASEFAQSEFYEYIALIFSDSGILLSEWKLFVLSLMESLPIVSSIAVLSITFLLLATTFLALRETKKYYQLKQLHYGH